MKLSRREHELAQYLILGKQNKEIAHFMHISVGSVKQMLFILYKKTDTRNRTEFSHMYRDKLAETTN